MEDEATQVADGAPPVRIVQLGGTFEAFGVVVDYLSRTRPFADFEVGAFANAIRSQLSEGQHLAAMAGPEMVGYAGWMLTSDAVGRAWVDSGDALVRVPAGQATAAALTIVAVSEPSVTRRLLRGARELNPGKRIYFKRGSEGEPRAPRKASVLNFSANSG